jgi:NAD(P) transhydrogenase subunit alpha
MTIGILKEQALENRVAVLPESAAAFIKLNTQIAVEQGAGNNASTSDADYTAAGAKISSRDEILSQSDIVISINGVEEADFNKLKNGAILVGQYLPLFNAAKMKTIAAKGITLFSMDMIPRTTRGQAMDVLSSQANLAGYKAVVLAATHYPKMFPMMMTAAGTITPAKVMVLGAGVAGLQAIATAKRLGAQVEAFDTRPAVKEEVMSLGAKFIEVEGAADASKAGGYAVEQTEDFIKRQKAKIHEHASKADIIITTAQIPGRKAPLLIEQATVEAMKPGSVVIDLAASTGGNCAFTKDRETVISANGIKIIGNSNLASDTAMDASKLYGKNLINFLKLIIDKEGAINLNWEDDLVKGTCVTHGGAVTNEKVAAG